MSLINISHTNDFFKAVSTNTSLVYESTNASDGFVTYSVISPHDLLFYLPVLPFAFLSVWTIRFLRQSVRTVDRIATSQCVVLLLGIPLVPVFAVIRDQITDIKTAYFYCQAVNFIKTVLGVFLVTSCFSIALIRYLYTVHATQTRQWNPSLTFKICLLLSLAFASLRGAQRLMWPGRLFRMCFGLEIQIKDLSVSWVPFLYGGTILPYVIIFVYTQLKKNRFISYQNMSLISVGGNIAVYVIQAAVSLVLQHLYRMSDLSTFALTEIMKNDLIYFTGSLAMSILVPLAYILFSVRVRDEAFKDIRKIVTFLWNSWRLIKHLWTPSSRPKSSDARNRDNKDNNAKAECGPLNEVSEADLQGQSNSSGYLPTSSSVAIVTSGHPSTSSISAPFSTCKPVGTFTPSAVFSTVTPVPSHLPLVSSSSPVKSSFHPSSFSPPALPSAAASTTPLPPTPPVDFSCSSSVCFQSASSALLSVSPASPTSCHAPQTASPTLGSVPSSRTLSFSLLSVSASSPSPASLHLPQTSCSNLLFVSPCSSAFSSTPTSSNTPATPCSPTLANTPPCPDTPTTLVDDGTVIRAQKIIISDEKTKI